MSFGTTRALNRAAAGAFSDREIELLAEYNARPGTARAFSRSVRDVIDRHGQHRHFLDRASEVRSLPPIALFWCNEDPLIPVAHGVRAAAHMEGVQLTRFPGVADFPHRQVPVRFAQVLEGFLAARELPSARLPRQGWTKADSLRGSRSPWLRWVPPHTTIRARSLRATAWPPS
jgi:pimeloyl-ACP methyl ester carboxylesterase